MKIAFKLIFCLPIMTIPNFSLFAQIELKNPAIIKFSPDAEKIAVFFDQDTIGYDDLYRPVDLQIIELSTGKKESTLRNQFTYLNNETAVYWINNGAVYFPDNNLFELNSDKVKKINISDLGQILGFSKSPNRFLYLDFDLKNHKYNLIDKRTENGEIKNISLGTIDRFFDESDAVPPINFEFQTNEDKLIFPGFYGNLYTLFQYDFKKSALTKLFTYKGTSLWDELKFIVLGNSKFVLNKQKRTLFLLTDSLNRSWEGILNVTVLDEENLLIQKQDGIYKINSTSLKMNQVNTNQTIENKILVKASKTKMIFIEKKGKSYKDRINYGTDFLVKIYQIDLVE